MNYSKVYLYIHFGNLEPLICTSILDKNSSLLEDT